MGFKIHIIYYTTSYAFYADYSPLETREKNNWRIT